MGTPHAPLDALRCALTDDRLHRGDPRDRDTVGGAADVVQAFAVADGSDRHDAVMALKFSESRKVYGDPWRERLGELRVVAVEPAGRIDL